MDITMQEEMQLMRQWLCLVALMMKMLFEKGKHITVR